MSVDEAIQILKRAADAKGQLLRCEADGAGPAPGRLLLTFDVGRVLLEPLVGGFSAKSLQDEGERPGGLRPLDEEEPWWRLLGNPLTSVEQSDASSEGTSGIDLRFREEAANPRVVRLVSEGTTIGVSLEPPHG